MGRVKTSLKSGTYRAYGSHAPGQYNMRDNQLVRQWELLRLLFSFPDGLTIYELADALESRETTIYQDIGILKEARFNIRKVTRAKQVLYHIPESEPVVPAGGE